MTDTFLSNCDLSGLNTQEEREKFLRRFAKELRDSSDKFNKELTCLIPE